MSSHTESQLTALAETMKRDWNDRARENAKWYINTAKLEQSEAEFDATGANEMQGLILPELVLLTQDRAPQSLRFLEIGCGIGRMTKHLAGLFGEVHATDVSGEMIARAKQRLAEFPNVHLYETSGVDFAALPTAYFDIVFSAYVFQHVPSKDVICANLREAFRVVKPGGLVRVHTNGVEADRYAEKEKDTWSGATFTEAELRALARELGAQLISVYGAGTLYCWTTLRKRMTPAVVAPGTPQIEFFARADDAAISVIPTAGKDAWLSLVVSGLEREWADASNVQVEINGQSLTPRYVGRVRPHFESAVAGNCAAPLNSLTYIEVAIPSGMAAGATPVSVRLATGGVSPAVSITLETHQPFAPKIATIRNGADFGTDICARGPKSLLRLFVDGLDETANCDNVRVRVGEHLLRPGFVGFVTDIAGYQVDAQLPADIAPGLTTLALLFHDVASVSAPLEILATES